MKKKPKIGALPTLNMPKRSHDATKPAARPSRTVVNDNPVTESCKKYYQSFIDLCKRVKTLKTLNDWIVQELEDRLTMVFLVSFLYLLKEHKIKKTSQWHFLRKFSNLLLGIMSRFARLF